MSKEAMIDLDSVISSVRKETTIDDNFVNQYAALSVYETIKDLKLIDDKYDRRFEALAEEKKKRYHKHYDTLVEQRKEVYKLLENSETEEQRKDYLNIYVDTALKLDALYAAAEKADESEKQKIIEMQKDEKKSRTIWMILQIGVPIVISVMQIGLASLLTNQGKKV